MSIDFLCDLGAKLAPFWRHFGRPGRLWGHLGASWARLGASWRTLGASLARLVRHLARLGASWARLGTSWVRLGAFWLAKLPQDKPDLTWNGKRRSFFEDRYGCLKKSFLTLDIASCIHLEASWIARSARFARCARSLAALV